MKQEKACEKVVSAACATGAQGLESKRFSAGWRRGYAADCKSGLRSPATGENRSRFSPARPEKVRRTNPKQTVKPKNAAIAAGGAA